MDGRDRDRAPGPDDRGAPALGRTAPRVRPRPYHRRGPGVLRRLRHPPDGPGGLEPAILVPVPGGPVRLGHRAPGPVSPMARGDRVAVRLRGPGAGGNRPGCPGTKAHVRGACSVLDPAPGADGDRVPRLHAGPHRRGMGLRVEPPPAPGPPAGPDLVRHRGGPGPGAGPGHGCSVRRPEATRGPPRPGAPDRGSLGLLRVRAVAGDLRPGHHGLLAHGVGGAVGPGSRIPCSERCWERRPGGGGPSSSSRSC
jgi:hypothetical protein